MKKYLIITLLFIGVNVVNAQIPADSIKAIIKEAISSKRSKSIVVGIVDANGRTIFSGGVLSDDDQRKPDGHTMYEIGSITKVFTSLVLAERSLQQKLNLNDPISKFLPGTVTTPKTNGKEITLFNLSTHTATFPRFPYNVDPKDLDDPYADYTTKNIYEYVSAFKPDIEIGTKWRYSNTAYGLLGNILTINAKAKSFEELIVQQICKPLNMHNTLITLTPAQKKNLARGYSEYGKQVNFIHLSAIEGGGALFSNTNDLLTFAAANLGLVNSGLWPAMELTHVKQLKKEANGDYATLGWTLVEEGSRNILFKDGGTPGFRTFIGIDKKNKFGVVVLSNSNNGVTDIGKHIIDRIFPVNPYQYPWNLLDTLRTAVEKNGTAAAIKLYKDLKTSNAPGYIFNENQLNYLGHELRRSKRIADAINIFELNLAEYPNSPLVYESLGEIYKRNGDKNQATGYFEKARTLDPNNPHWDFILTRLKALQK